MKKTNLNPAEKNGEKADAPKRKNEFLLDMPLEVDLENRKLFFCEKAKQKLDFEFRSNNIDQVIDQFVHPHDSVKVKDHLANAGKGVEKPLTFNFVDPKTSRVWQLEYRYQIVYVKYASTRLQGVLVNLRRLPSL